MAIKNLHIIYTDFTSSIDKKNLFNYSRCSEFRVIIANYMRSL